jgi:hypothetical protein
LRCTKRPRLFHSQQGEGSAEQRHVFAEVDHVVHALVGIFDVPEIVHSGRNGLEKGDYGRRAKLRLPSQGDARAAKQQHGARSNHSRFRHGNILGSSVLRHALAIPEMVDPVVEEESSEHQSSGKESGSVHQGASNSAATSPLPTFYRGMPESGRPGSENAHATKRQGG